MNLAQAINGEAVCDGRLSAPRCEPRPAVSAGPRILPKWRPTILAALRGKALNASDLYAACGGVGSKASFGVELAHLKTAGLIVADGERGKFIYRLPGEAT